MDRFDPSLYLDDEGRKGLVDLTPRDLARESLEILREQRSQLDRLLGVVVVEGQRYANYYCETAAEMCAEDKTLLCTVGTRARLYKGSFEAVWLRRRFVKGPKDSQTQVFTAHIAKGRGLSYSMNQFRGRRDGPFRELIESVEVHYRGLRERAGIITEARRRLRMYERRVVANLSERDRLVLQGEGLIPESELDED